MKRHAVLLVACGLALGACAGTSSAPAVSPEVAAAPRSAAVATTPALDTVAPITVVATPEAPEATITPPPPSTTQVVAPETPVPGADSTFDAAYLSLEAGRAFPSLDDPPMVPVAAATWLDPDDIVLGVVGTDGEAHAFPASQMAFHHIVNTTVAGEPYLVTY